MVQSDPINSPLVLQCGYAHDGSLSWGVQKWKPAKALGWVTCREGCVCCLMLLIVFIGVFSDHKIIIGSLWKM